MKKKITNVIIAIMIITITSVIWNIPRIKYDVNRDGKVNSKDLLDLRLYLIGKGE